MKKIMILIALVTFVAPFFVFAETDLKEDLIQLEKQSWEAWKTGMESSSNRSYRMIM